MPDPENKLPRPVPPPVVTFRESEAGRETLAAIAEDRMEARHPMAHRGPASTKHYGDRISNAPGAVSPKVAKALDDAPEVTFSMVPAGRATYAVISGEARHEAPDIEIHPDVEPDTDEELNLFALSIEQQHTFIVRAPARYLRTKRSRSRLVEMRLLAHMPGVRSEDVTKIVIEPHGDEASLVRIWARLAPARR